MILPDTSAAPLLEPHKIIAGPYLTEVEADEVTMRFYTNRQCTVGLQFIGTASKEDYTRRTVRYAAANKAHAIPIKAMQSGKDIFCRLLVNDQRGGVIQLRSASLPGERVDLTFFGGGVNHPQLLWQADGLLRKIWLDACFMLGNMTPEKTSLYDWRTRFFDPLVILAERTPFYFVPGGFSRATEKYFPSCKDLPALWARGIWLCICGGD